MLNFTRQIQHDGQLLEFSFLRILTANGPKYFVMVPGSYREYHFIIEKLEGEWVINDAPRVPDWVHDLEGILIKAIVENEALARLD